MKQLRCSLTLKITAFILVILSAVAAAGTGASLLYGYDQGIYGATPYYEQGQWKIPDGTIYTTPACRAAAYTYAWHVVEGYTSGIDVANSYDDYYSFDFTLRSQSATGEVLASTMDSDASYGYRVGQICTADASEQTWVSREGKEQSGEYYVEIAVTNPLRGRDDFFAANQLFEHLKWVEPALVPILVGALLLGLLSAIWLFCAVGHKKGSDEIVVGGLHRIPLDFYALALGLGVILLTGQLIEELLYFYYELPLGLALIGIILTLTGILALTLLLSITVRIKAGKWWRNTLTYYILKWLVGNSLRGLRILNRCIRALPMIWRAVVVILAVLLVDFFLIYCASQSSVGIFLFALYNGAILAGIFYGVWQLRRLQHAGKELAKGNFSHKIDTNKMYWNFKKHAENLNSIAGGMSIALDEKMRSERLKTELITNVSHDIKTPLTSIINYVDLLQKPHSPQEETEYLAVLERQSARLKKLTEDLVEASKASTGNVAANLIRTNVAEIVNQALGEYAQRLTAGNLTVVTDLEEKDAGIMADGRLMWRILDNLLSNVCKYALCGTRVYVSVHNGEEIVIGVKNISRQPLNISADELMERFVRGDAARSTDGSGLGLNIARSLTQLQGGRLDLFVDGDLFKAQLRFPRA